MDRQYFKQNVSPTNTYEGTVAHTLEIISKVVGATYGPYGTYNVFKDGNNITASKDGYENLSRLNFDGSIASAVRQMVYEVADSQAKKVGDGTTTAVLVLAELYKQLVNDVSIKDKYTPSEIQRVVHDIQGYIISSLESLSTPIVDRDQVYSVVYTSVDGNDEMADLLMELYDSASNLRDRNVVLDISTSDNGFIKTVEGVTIRGKLMHQGFANYDIDQCLLRNVEIIVVDGKPNIMNDIINYANKLKAQDKSLLIICSGVNEGFYRYIEVMSQKQPEFLRNMAVVYTQTNTMHNKDDFNDLINAIGCSYLHEESEISASEIDELSEGARGHASIVSIKDKVITLSGFNQGEAFNNYINTLKEKEAQLLEESHSNVLSPEDSADVSNSLNKIRARIAKLTEGVTTVYVGGDSIQRKTINYRLIEDGLKALQSALRSGHLAGCNSITMSIIHNLMSQQYYASGADNIYYKVLANILKAYINVNTRIISNKFKIKDAKYVQAMMDPEAFKAYYAESSGTVLPLTREDVAAGFYRTFIDFDLRGNSPDVSNPTETDINIVQRAFDTAIVLVCANTMFVEDTEFDARP